MCALAGEQDDDGVDEADKGPWADEAEEVMLVVVLAKERTEGETGDDCGAEGDAQEDGHGFCGFAV